MEILIRNSRISDYTAAENIMEQVHQLHIGWRPDIYKQSGAVLPFSIYQQAVENGTFFVAEYGGKIAGILLILYQHMENPNHVTRNIIFVDAMAVDENFRGRGIGHAFFAFLQNLKEQKGYDGIELQVNSKNKAAYQFYSSYGFTEQSIHMELL